MNFYREIKKCTWNFPNFKIEIKLRGNVCVAFAGLCIARFHVLTQIQCLSLTQKNHRKPCETSAQLSLGSQVLLYTYSRVPVMLLDG